VIRLQPSPCLGEYSLLRLGTVEEQRFILYSIQFLTFCQPGKIRVYLSIGSIERIRESQ
jgi:hypothetical protein